MLDPGFIAALALQCAPHAAAETLVAIAYTESRFDPLAIGVNAGPRLKQRPRDAAGAAREARRLMAAGFSIDLGLSQINSANLDWLGLTIEDAFDPCRNLAAAATVLNAGYRARSNRPQDRQAALRMALSRYNTGHPERGVRNGYVARVEAAAIRFSRGPSRPAASFQIASVTDPTPVPVPAAWDVFARASSMTTTVFLSAPLPAETRKIP